MLLWGFFPIFTIEESVKFQLVINEKMYFFSYLSVWIAWPGVQGPEECFDSKSGVQMKTYGLTGPL